MNEKCRKCKRTPQEGALSPLFIDGGYTPPICAVCALAMTNQFHGIKRGEFTGTMAQQMLEKTREHYAETGQ